MLPGLPPNCIVYWQDKIRRYSPQEYRRKQWPVKLVLVALQYLDALFKIPSVLNWIANGKLAGKAKNGFIELTGF